MADKVLVQKSDIEHVGTAVVVLINVAANEALLQGHTLTSTAIAAAEIVGGMFVHGEAREALMVGGFTMLGLAIFDVISGQGLAF